MIKKVNVMKGGVIKMSVKNQNGYSLLVVVLVAVVVAIIVSVIVVNVTGNITLADGNSRIVRAGVNTSTWISDSGNMITRFG